MNWCIRCAFLPRTNSLSTKIQIERKLLDPSGGGGELCSVSVTVKRPVDGASSRTFLPFRFSRLRWIGTVRGRDWVADMPRLGRSRCCRPGIFFQLNDFRLPSAILSNGVTALT